MRLMLRVFAASLLVLPGGCVLVSVTPAETHAAIPDDTHGFIAGRFTRDKDTDLAFVIHNLDTGADYNMSLGDNSRSPTAVTNEVLEIKVPPGHYAVKQWVTFATLTKERFIKADIRNPYLAAPFTLKAGSVAFLGDFLISGTANVAAMSWDIRPRPIHLEEAHRVFTAAYPAFQNNTFECRLCIETVPTLLGRVEQ